MGISIKQKLFPSKPMTPPVPPVDKVAENLEHAWPPVNTTTVMPSVADVYARASKASTEINLVRMVEEYGPRRLEQIDATIAGLRDKITKLEREREQVQALVLTLKR